MTTSPAFALAPPGAVEFGDGALKTLPAAVQALGKTRAFIVTDPGIRACGILGQVRELLDAAHISHEVFAEVEPNPSLATIDRATIMARRFGNAVVVAVGGGSSLDAAKGIALAATNEGSVASFARSPGDLSAGLPVIAIPTTAGTGAETNGFGVIEDTAAHCKIYLGDTSVAPRIAILDPSLTLGLPPAVTAATGVDALVHAIESLTSRSRNAVSDAYAHHAAKLVSTWLPTAVNDGANAEARGELLLGSHLAGLALSVSGLGLVHGIAHAVTAHTGSPHGVALASVLKEVLVFNLPESAAEYAAVAFDLGVGATSSDETANARATIAASRALVEQIGTYRPLRELGCTEEMIPTLVHTALADPVTRNTPRIPTNAELTELLGAAL